MENTVVVLLGGWFVGGRPHLKVTSANPVRYGHRHEHREEPDRAAAEKAGEPRQAAVGRWQHYFA